ncbi:5-oxoprolinase subunit B family protein [Mycolicibacter kumamotonensis]|jgi:KipI family sensor histidine kinase inhibitor|uniref:Allophanate hydrolase n=1 Tax=Mycolicibacter kumamotonensis TaxID=354243 RepID=A0A1B8SHD1_9MYCO|nr:carboxyltransferase domain-containing protein [Mycolicibacter kumamotonensis]OBY32106.1 allophanate hydrolase [Mycolicibacter kumamotonensis]ORA80114.1 allophanate hydrolase [Mycolicibacter kumamotonensis]
MSATLASRATDTILDYGDCALLLQFDRTAEVLAWTAALSAAALPGVIDIVPASRTVLVKLDGPDYQTGVRRRLAKLSVEAEEIATTPADAAVDVVIDVVYDGPDLAEVAERTGLTVAQVINAHTETPWRVGFGGSTPGFAYLIGGDPRLQVPRRAELRDAVPAGSVALAGQFSGIYPRQWPGGWQLIGRTDAVLWDLARPSPALLTPGRTVQFRAA